VEGGHGGEEGFVQVRTLTVRGGLVRGRKGRWRLRCSGRDRFVRNFIIPARRGSIINYSDDAALASNA